MGKDELFPIVQYTYISQNSEYVNRIYKTFTIKPIKIYNTTLKFTMGQ